MAERRVKKKKSGKVNRQMFEAQTQLSLALNESRRKRVAKKDDCLLSGDAAASTSQQLTDTHNISTRNTHCSGGKKSEDQDDIEAVRSLPDTVVPAKKNSDIIDRLQKKRRKKHDEALSQLQSELSSISEGLEPFFRQMGKDILLRLSENDANIERLMQTIENQCDLKAHSYEDMTDIFNKVCHESSLKKKWIKELNEFYAKKEDERRVMITAVLKKYTTKLEKICYLMPDDVHRLMDNEAMTLNQALLANRRALAKLHLNLMEKHLQMDYSQKLRWEEKLQDWKTMKLNDAICQFNNFMTSSHIQNPKSIEDILRTMKSDQKTLSEKRIETLEILRDMTPPRISKSSVAEWYTALSEINQQIDCVHVATIVNLQKAYENNWQVCLSEVDLFKTEISRCGFTSDEIQNIVDLEILPLIGRSQSQTEVYLEKLEKAFESLVQTAANESKCLYKFMCGAAQLWENHCEGLLTREQQYSMESVSQVHDHENQRKEAELDMMLDKLRQESTEEALKASLEKTLAYLEEIKNGYMNIYKEEVETVERYPSVVLQELQAYSLAVSQFFSVKEVYGQNSKDFCQVYPSLKLGQSVSAIKNEKKKKEYEVKHKGTPKPHYNNQDSSASSSSCAMDDQAFSFSQSKETLTTAEGNVYNCYGFHTTHDQEQEINLKETELVLFPKAHIVELLKDLRQKNFCHLEERFQMILTNTMNVLEAKKEKLKAKLELHLQLHQPRAVRIEMDVHNVRAAELLQHRERVDRHLKGVQDVLEDSRTELQDLQIQQNALIKEFQMLTYKEVTFATTSEKINQLCTLLQINMDNLINVIQTSQRDFRQKIELRMEGLRESNVQIMRSFKLFSEGGNFTPQEIEVFQSHLEELDKRIDSAEGGIIQDMEERESKCLEQAKDIHTKFEEEFRFHAIDLKFLEKMQQIFTNTRVQIKSEASKSNMQKKAIDRMLSDLKQTTAEYHQPSPDKKIITIDEITSLLTSLMEELNKRCHYLDCFLDASMAIPRPQTPLQGAYAVAARSRSRIQEKADRAERDVLLRPSQMGVPFLDDPIVGVIKGLLRIGKAEDVKEVNSDPTERHSSTEKVNSPLGSGRRLGKSLSPSGIESLRRTSAESTTLPRIGKAKDVKEVNSDPTERHSSTAKVNSPLGSGRRLGKSLSPSGFESLRRTSAESTTLPRIGKAKDVKEVNSDPTERHSSTAKVNSPLGSGRRLGKSLSPSGIESLRRTSAESTTLPRIGKAKDVKEVNSDPTERHSSTAKVNSPLGSGRRLGKSLSPSGIESLRRTSAESTTLPRIGKAKDVKEVNSDPTERHSSTAKVNSPLGSGRRLGKSPSLSEIESLHRTSAESTTLPSISVGGRELSKPNRFDKKFLIFGSKPEEQMESVPFKASINSILWKANDILLFLAEEFYKKKECHPITYSEQLQETFDQCAEEINNTLLSYQSQAHDYHNSCLQGFHLQLKPIEDFLSSIPDKLFSKLRDQYLEELTQSMTQINQQFELVQQQSEQKRRKHSRQLRVHLSLPEFETELKQLVEAEDERQRQQEHAIQNTRQEVQACVLKNAEEFVTALAGLAETLLLQFDHLITIHDVQVGHAEQKKVHIITLIRQKKAGLLLEDRRRDILQRGTRTWPGICYFESTDGRSFHEQSQKTAFITTMKTTQAHLKTIETRDAVHENYGQRVQEKLDKTQREFDAQLRHQQQWHEHWHSELKSLASL